MFKRILFAFYVFITLLSCDMQAHASTTDAIAIIVRNNIANSTEEAITALDIKERSELIKLSNNSMDPNLLKKLATQQLIDESLVKLEAIRLGIVVPQELINSAFANIAEGLKLSPQTFAATLEQAGVKPESLMKQIKSRIFWQRLSFRLHGVFEASDQETIDALERGLKLGNKKLNKNAISRGKSTEYNLHHVVMLAKPNHSKSRLAQAEQIRSRQGSKGCENLTTAISGFAEIAVKPIGKVLSDDSHMAGNQEALKILEDTPVGGLSKPALEGDTINMYAVCSKRIIKGNQAAVKDLKNSITNEKAQTIMRQYVYNLKRNAVIIYK